MTDTSTTTAPPPLPFDPDAPRCRAHRHVPAGQPVDCQACREARAWVEKRQAEQDAAARARVRECPMCDRGGQRWDPGTHIAVSPLWTCDHDTPHEDVVAEIAAMEDRAERARATLPPRPPVPSTASGRARARAMFRPRRPALPVPAQRGPDDPVGRESAQRELTHAAAAPTGKSGLDEGGSSDFDHEMAV